MTAVLFEVRCPGCGALGWCPCERCIAALADPEHAAVEGTASVALLFSHTDVGREFIHALKYRGERAIARWLGASLALAHLAVAEPGSDVGVVTWAPTTVAHRRARGFDQSEALARATARNLSARPACLLRRTSRTAQSGASRLQRLAGPRFSPRRSLAGQRVLLIDDVLTTGATMRSAAAALRAGGAVAVHVAVCARRGSSQPAARA